MACPLCYTPVLAAAGSLLGVPLDARLGYGLSGLGGGAMLSVAHWRSSGCSSKLAYVRLNRYGGAILLAYATVGICWESMQHQVRAPCCRTESTSS